MRLIDSFPEPFQQSGNYNILIRLKHFTETGSRHTVLEQHCIRPFIPFENTHCGIAVEKTKSRDLVIAFHVGHSQLENCCASVRSLSNRHPRAADILSLERITELDRPALGELGN